MSTTVTGYSRTQIILHWVIAAIVVFQVLGHDAIVEFSDAIAKGLNVEQTPVMVRAHVLLGGSTLVLAIWRVILRVTRGVPEAPSEESAPLRMIAKLVHWGLYAVIFLMPLSGMAAWFGGIENAAKFHGIFKFAMMAIIALHVVGALYQQYVLKTGIIKRMMKAQ